MCWHGRPPFGAITCWAADSSSADLVQMDYFPAAFPVLLASAGMLGLVAVMSAWKGRLYCNTVCPVGTLLGLLSRISLFRLGFDPASCKKCGKCVKSCKAQCLNLKEYKIDFSRCVACYDCVRSCSEGGIRYRWFTRARQLIPAQKKKAPPAPAPSSSAAVPSIAGSSRRQFLEATAAGWPRPPFPDAGEMPPGSWTPPSAFFLPEPVPWNVFWISALAARCALPTALPMCFSLHTCSLA